VVAEVLIGRGRRHHAEDQPPDIHPVLGYTPVGRGKVDLTAILDMVGGRAMDGMVMVELDSSDTMPIPPRGTAAIARTWLDNRGHQFRG